MYFQSHPEWCLHIFFIFNRKLPRFVSVEFNYGMIKKLKIIVVFIHVTISLSLYFLSLIWTWLKLKNKSSGKVLSIQTDTLR